MKHLAIPVTVSADREVAQKICLDPVWAPHKVTWLNSYDHYRNHKGNPWLIRPLAYPLAVRNGLYELYDTRKSSGPLTQIRRTPGLLSCPICGSPTTGGLDHYLPRAVYPEFSIMRANLVPACSHCNTGAKSSIVKGTFPERFIHPYFDAWANSALWLAKPRRPYAAVTFLAKPMSGLPPKRVKIVKFHLANVLGTQFHQSLETKFSTLPELLAINIDKPKPARADIERQLSKDLKLAIVSSGVNSWNAAFFRGVLASPGAISHLHRRALLVL